MLTVATDGTGAARGALPARANNPYTATAANRGNTQGLVCIFSWQYVWWRALFLTSGYFSKPHQSARPRHTSQRLAMFLKREIGILRSALRKVCAKRMEVW